MTELGSGRLIQVVKAQKNIVWGWVAGQ